MHVQEVPLIVFRELVPNFEVFNMDDYAKNLYPSTHRKGDYEDKLSIAGEVEDGVFARSDIVVGCYSYLSLHSSLTRAVLADTMFDSAFALAAGTKSGESWAFGRGSSVRQAVWVQQPSSVFEGISRLIELTKISVVAGRITARAVGLLNTGAVDVTSYFEADLKFD